MTPEALLRLQLWLLLGAAGAIVGSFLNVCIHRLPIGRSVVSPPSACPACGARIKPWNNVPVLAWFWLRGRCADCRAPISFRYPAIEALHALLWLATAWRFGLTTQTLVLLPFVSALVVLFFTDWDTQLLPDAVTLPLAVVGLAVAPWNTRLDFAPWALGAGTGGMRLLHAALAAALGFGIFLALALGWKVFFGREGMGGGDLKLMLGVGAFTGLGGVLLTIFLASVVGALISVPLLYAKRWTMQRELPFGCFLVPAALVASFHGNELLRWYLRLI